MYTQQLGILDQLDTYGWRRVPLDDIVLDWWAAEVWLLQSLWAPQDCTVYLTFQVDPGFEGPREANQAVYAVSASLNGPVKSGKPSLYMGRGWRDGLAEFFAGIAQLRSEWRPSYRNADRALQVNEPFRFSYRLTGSRSVEAEVSSGSQSVYMYVWMCVEDIEQLARGVSLFMRDPTAKEVQFDWLDEQNAVRWVISREESGLLVRILGSSWRTPSEYSVEFEARCSILRLATQVKGQLLQLLNTHGLVQYESLWGKEFPTDALEELTELIRRQKHAEGGQS